MADVTLRSLRCSRSIAALLVLISVLAGLGRGPALASGPVWTDAFICHTGPVSGSEHQPAQAQHECCGICGVCAVGLLPDGITDETSSSVGTVSLTASGRDGVVGRSRLRTPRQAQAPPPGPRHA